MKKVCLSDVAKAANVSIMTASRAFDPLKQNLLKKQTMEKVLKVAEELGFKRNITARRFKRQSSETILYKMPFFPSGRSNPFFNRSHFLFNSYIAKGVSEEIQKWGYELKFEGIYDEDNPLSQFEQKEELGYEGIISIGLPGIDFYRRHPVKKTCPLLIANMMELQDCECPVCFIDTETGMKQAVDYLINKGHSNIAYLSMRPDYNKGGVGFRFLGYKKVLEQNGAFCEKLIYILPDVLSLRKWLEAFKGQLPFSAVCCQNDEMAAALLTELEYLGIDVPQDVAVVGFDDNQFISKELGLSTIGSPFLKLGQLCAKTLLDNIEHGQEILPMQQLASFFIPRYTT